MTPTTVLVRAPDLDVHLGDGDNVTIVIGDERLEVTPLALLVLHAFAHPRTVADVLAGAAAGTQDWIELSSTVLRLERAGVLIAPGSRPSRKEGFAQPSIHVVMLDDRARTLGFIRAIQALVRKDDVVLDIGTGTGILAASAALAGAARVHAIESSAIGDAAERVFETNGIADRVSLTRGRSTRVTLSEPCTLLVTELIGNDPLDEQLLEVVADAKARLLTPNARFIPSAIEIFAVPVDVPRRVLERRLFSAERISAWRTSYGVDLSPLLAVRPTAAQPMSIPSEEVSTWQRIASPVPLISIDFSAPYSLVHRTRVSFSMDRDVERLGVVLAFRATLAPGIELSTLPDAAGPDNHWRYPLWPSIDQPSYARGTSVVLDYAYDRGTSSISFI